MPDNIVSGIHNPICDIHPDLCDIPKLPGIPGIPGIPGLPGLPVIINDEIKKLYIKLQNGMTVREMFQEIGDDPDKVYQLFTDAIANNRVTYLRSPHLDNLFHGFNDWIKKLNKELSDEEVAFIHDIAQLSGQVYVEKQPDGERGNYDDCVDFVRISVGAAAVYFEAQATVGLTNPTSAAASVVTLALAAYIQSESPSIAAATCHRIYK
ncbi:hypothetical protein ABEW32_15845 [Paenibacillus jamilae]|uniref:hypothetical protein n=1 Tax=Paenibacillus jamilae TaxID=114136 RepID=UPI003D2E169D